MLICIERKIHTFLKEAPLQQKLVNHVKITVGKWFNMITSLAKELYHSYTSYKIRFLWAKLLKERNATQNHLIKNPHTLSHKGSTIFMLLQVCN